MGAAGDNGACPLARAVRVTTILLIESPEPRPDNTAAMLALAGYAVLPAADGKREVELARSAAPDLIICDVTPPELDGLGVLHMLHQDPATTSIPFLFLTAKAAREDVERGMSAGADDDLTNPCEATVLLAAIAMRLGKHAAPLSTSGEAPAGLPALHSGLAAHLKSYRKKHVLFLEGDIPHSMYWLRHGAAKTDKTDKTDKSGNEYSMELGQAGDFMGYADLLAATDCSALAMLPEDGTVGVLPRQDFFALLAQHSDGARHFSLLLAQTRAARERQLLHQAYQSVRQRLSQALLHVAQTLQPLAHLDHGTAVSREDLAALVGASKETVSRMLSDFRAQGLVEITGHHIIIMDAARLRRARS